MKKILFLLFSVFLLTGFASYATAASFFPENVPELSVDSTYGDNGEIGLDALVRYRYDDNTEPYEYDSNPDQFLCPNCDDESISIIKLGYYLENTSNTDYGFLVTYSFEGTVFRTHETYLEADSGEMFLSNIEGFTDESNLGRFGYTDTISLDTPGTFTFSLDIYTGTTFVEGEGDLIDSLGTLTDTIFDDIYMACGDTDDDTTSGGGSGNDTTPVPEPSTYLLLGSGLAGLAWYRRKSMKA